ncbi:3-demethylubiquinone-9 3-methyltransferase, partial [Leucoagaricus sp. SymC.cos]
LQRLNLQHLIWTKLIGGLYPSDLADVIERRLSSNADSEVLDIGCGTGIWAFEMSTRFPKIRVTGLDITDWNHSCSTLPQNYQFMQCDISKGLPQKFSARFDLIQCRTVLQHLTHPQRLVDEMAWCLKPGGVLLVADLELSQGSFNRSKARIKPFIYSVSMTPEENIRAGDSDREVSWLAGWLRAFGLGLESEEYQRPDKLAEKSDLLTDVKLRDIWMDVAFSDSGLSRGKDQDVRELISVNYLRVFDAVRSILARQGIPISFVQDVWEKRILLELETREFTSLWHFVSAVRRDAGEDVVDS